MVVMAGAMAGVTAGAVEVAMEEVMAGDGGGVEVVWKVLGFGSVGAVWGLMDASNTLLKVSATH